MSDINTFKLGYNTNGFICHDLKSAICIIGELGYQSVAITLDHASLNPWQADIKNEINAVKKVLCKHKLACIIETGARFLLDPRQKHEPTLISEDIRGRKQRLDFLKKAVDIAVALKAEALSFWSGKKNSRINDSTALKWLVAGCRELSGYAQKHKMPLAFEPEPGMFIETLDQYLLLKEKVANDIFGLTLDLGHAFLTEKQSVAECIEKFAHEINNIHIEDMQKGKHEHLFFGQGDIDFKKIFKALKEIGYKGQVNVELSRHSHNAVETAKKAKAFLEKKAEYGNQKT